MSVYQGIGCIIALLVWWFLLFFLRPPQSTPTKSPAHAPPPVPLKSVGLVLPERPAHKRHRRKHPLVALKEEQNLDFSGWSD